MRINERLNLVVPIDQSAGTIFVHAMPIARETFEANFLLLSKTFAAIHGHGLGSIAGPRVAAMMLRTVADDMDAAVAGADLLTEIRRLANVVMPNGAGWTAVPFHDAAQRQLIDPEDVGEVMNSLVFFTLGSHLYPRNSRAGIVMESAKLWGAQITSLNCTEYAASLPTSTAVASSGATQEASAVTVSSGAGTPVTSSLPV